MSEVNPAVAALIARYRTAPAAVPNVNPPEAAKVIEAQTAPEIAAVPAPETVVITAADVSAATGAAWTDPTATPAPLPVVVEPPKARRSPGRPPKAAAPAAEPPPAAEAGTVERATTEALVAELRDRGYRVTLEER